MVYNKENTIAFNSKNEHFILSNMYPCKLVCKGLVFCGVDHLFHYSLFKECPEIQAQIAECNGICGNFNAKKISKANKNLIPKENYEQRHDILRQCIKLKYKQCRLFREYLDATKGKDLVEYTEGWYDTEYGCVEKGNEYVGENICGKILMKIRDKG